MKRYNTIISKFLDKKGCCIDKLKPDMVDGGQNIYDLAFE